MSNPPLIFVNVVLQFTHVHLTENVIRMCEVKSWSTEAAANALPKTLVCQPLLGCKETKVSQYMSWGTQSGRVTSNIWSFFLSFPGGLHQHISVEGAKEPMAMGLRALVDRKVLPSLKIKLRTFLLWGNSANNWLTVLIVRITGELKGARLPWEGHELPQKPLLRLSYKLYARLDFCFTYI